MTPSRISLGEDHGKPVERPDRKPLTEAQRVALWNAQGGLCGNGGCGRPIPHKGPGVIDEHLICLTYGGPKANDLENRALFCTECAAEKTAKDRKQIRHVNAMAFKNAGGKKPGAGRLKGRGFAKWSPPDFTEARSGSGVNNPLPDPE